MVYAEITPKVPLEVVVIGGGTGNKTVLSGLTPWVGEGLTTVVNTFDDGGSTGMIRDEYGGIALGDMRQCARVMSGLSSDALLVLEGRFPKGSGNSDMNVHRHNVGNLLLEQAHQMFKGDPDRIAAAYSDIYRIRGHVFPVTHESRRLKFTLPDGTVVLGEHNAEESKIPSFMGAQIDIVGGEGETTINEAAEAAIERADMVILAPGDLYTSIGPNLVVKGMKEAISKATAVIMVANLMNRARHTSGFSALDYATEYERLTGERVIDRVLYNTRALDADALRDQALDGSHPVVVNHEGLIAAGYQPVGKDLLSTEKVILDPNDAIASTRSNIRHDPERVAHALMGIYFGNGFAEKTA